MTNARHLSLSSDHYTPREVVEAARPTMGGIDLDPASCRLANNEIVKALRYYGPGSANGENGFTTSWEGKVFLNPPGGKCDQVGNPASAVLKLSGQSRSLHKLQSSQKAWWFKLATEWLQGRVEQAIFIGFSLEILQVAQSGNASVRGTDHRGAPVLPIPLDFPCCYPKKRIAYLKEVPGILTQGYLGERTRRPVRSSLVEGGSPPHASVIIWLPPRDDYGGRLGHFERAFSPLGKVVIPPGYPGRVEY